MEGIKKWREVRVQQFPGADSLSPLLMRYGSKPLQSWEGSVLVRTGRCNYIDLIKPITKDSTDDLPNLQPLQLEMELQESIVDIRAVCRF
jgi:hypothetical protein